MSGEKSGTGAKGCLVVMQGEVQRTTGQHSELSCSGWGDCSMVPGTANLQNRVLKELCNRRKARFRVQEAQRQYIN